MECDWEIEIASDAPVIDGAWDGFIDLRLDPTRVSQIEESAQFPALADMLVRLNTASSPIWTAKCDVWTVDEVDPGELDADVATAREALGCYVDLLPSDPALFSTLDASADWCRRLCLDLHGQPARDCRFDAVIRRAFLTPEIVGLGITAYLTACGSSKSEAAMALSCAIIVVSDSVMALGPRRPIGFEVQ